MKVKELIKKLKELDQEANVVSQEYTGGRHTIHDIEKVESFNKGSKVGHWDSSSGSDVIDEKGECIANVVYIN